MEITERFPQELGNLAQNASFPHSHKPIPLLSGEKNVEWTALRLDHFPSGVLVYFPSGASTP
jgi:hypothetical protein